MKKITFFILLVVLFSSFSLSTKYDGAKDLLNQNLSYSQLTDDQFEIIGDYFMEQMTGSNHEYMDEMMGGHGSEELRQVHINLGRNMYSYYQDYGELPSQAMPIMNSYNGMMGNSDYTKSGWGHMMYPGYGNMFWGMGFFGIALMIGFWILVIWAIIWIANKITGKKKKK